jgi:hypothetical protein
MTIETGTRRVRHEVADGVRVMAFSICSSVLLAVLVALVLGSL